MSRSLGAISIDENGIRIQVDGRKATAFLHEDGFTVTVAYDDGEMKKVILPKEGIIGEPGLNITGKTQIK